MGYIEIELMSDLSVGNGESRGNSVDSDVCVDEHGFPYIPARRLKGCLRFAAEELKQMQYKYATDENIEKLFGSAFGQEGLLRIQDAKMKNIDMMGQWVEGNYKEKGILKKMVHPQKVTDLYTKVRGQTAMEDGVKIDNTLRFSRVMLQQDPVFSTDDKMGNCKFYSRTFVEDMHAGEDIESLLEACCKAMRHIGQNRNRGLGNVRCRYDQAENNQKMTACPRWEKEEKVTIQYKISLDAPVSLLGVDGMRTVIPAKSVIGCVVKEYLKNGSAQEKTFEDLFLNGTVRWSSVTPVIDGKRSVPAPYMIMKLKNGDGKVINRFAESKEMWEKYSRLKPKTLDCTFVVDYQDEEGSGYCYGTPRSKMSYHNSKMKKELYMQKYLVEGAIYSGNIEVPGRLCNQVVDLLKHVEFRFGRSRGAEYAACSLLDISLQEKEETLQETKEDERVFVLLEEDMVLDCNGVYCVDNEYVRRSLSEKLGLKNEVPENCLDLCQYGITDGYQAMWQLQKMHVPVIKAGSVYCFKSKGGPLPIHDVMGEFIQEGLGRFTIVPECKMQQYSIIKKSEIDKKNIEVDTECVKMLKNALLVDMVKEALRKRVKKLVVEVEEEVPIGRLRLFLSESENISELRSRIITMSTADVDSQKTKGKRDISERVIKKIYGNSSGIDWKGLLTEEEGLWEMIKEDEVLINRLKRMWKLPMRQFLHELHYQKER